MSVINDWTEVEVILPCLNEAEGLVWVLASMPAGVQSAALRAPTHPLPHPS